MLKWRFWPDGGWICFIVGNVNIMIVSCFCHDGPPILEVQDAALCSAFAVAVVMVSMPHIFILDCALAFRIALSLLIAIERKVNQDLVL